MTKNKRKIFVLDTSVILHDHNAINNFDEHDVAIPITVLEELDNFKRGSDIKNYEAREFIRMLDKMSKEYKLNDWIPIDPDLPKKGKFKIVMANSVNGVDAEKIFGKKNDHTIINAALTLIHQEKGRRVILLSKDINLRLKAKSLLIEAEDYETGKISNINNLYSGKNIVGDVQPEMIEEIYKKGYTDNLAAFDNNLINNSFYILKNNESSILTYFNAHENILERVEKTYVFGIKPKNAEQTFAIHALLDNNVKLVTIQGVAGTGKTLLALASALEQKNKYHQIVLARPIVPLSNKDIGFLPGSAEDKVNPYMQPLYDNLKYIKSQFKETEKKYKILDEMEQDGSLKITPLAFIRGRSLSNIIFIIDEAQNLTPHEVKTIITRAGENTKIVFTGDVHQIDTPYLDEQSNGLSYIIDKLKGSALFAHITLEKGERSELANLANELL
jgi:PhoH-like ATPase